MELTTPVTDSVPKVNNELAVGDDLVFQRRWWHFERVIWVLFLAIVIADLLGCFGRGYFANAELKSTDGMTDIHYQRIERFSTPSILTVQFGPNAVHDGQVKLWVSGSLLKPLGNQRVIPQPSASILQKGGVLYTFASSSQPSSVEFALEPATFGIFPLTMQVPGSDPVNLRIYVMP
jgi:hypothetical protein